MEEEIKHVYCSSCKHSKYEQDGAGRRFLHCYQREALGMKTRIPTDCTDAEECLDYMPERRSDAIRDERSFHYALKHAGVRRVDS